MPVPEHSAEDKVRADQAAAAAASAASAGVNKFLGDLLHTKRMIPVVENLLICWSICWLNFVDLICNLIIQPRLVFPTLQKNESVFTILPTFVSVLGKKIDAASVQKDYY